MPSVHSTLVSLAWLASGVLALPSSNAYDYVIVGGGNAGLTLAARLTENPCITVAVIEAGTFFEDVAGDQSEIPGNAPLFNGKSPALTNPLVEWGYMTTPQPGMADQTIHVPRGKTFGGSTAINAMGYLRPAAGGMDRWADEVGDDSWTWDNTLPYFQKSVAFTAPDMTKRFANSTPQYDPALLTTNGPVPITHPNYAQPFSSWFAAALPEVGMPHIPGFTSGDLIGSGWLIHTIDQSAGLRTTSQTSFLTPFLSRPNLVLYDNSRAEKILFSGTVATGVQVSSTTTDDTFSLLASKEVVVSAGVFNSPQLLMVSGVGPADVLQDNNIPVVVDSPGVGQNMQDHFFFGISYQVDLQLAHSLSDPAVAAAALQLYQDEQAGPFSGAGGDYAAAEKLPIRTGFSAATETGLSGLPSDWPEVLYLSLPAYVGDFYSPLTSQPAEGNYATILASIVAPMSRGNVTITSSSTSDAPVVNPNWITHQSDIEVAIAAFKRMRDMYETQALQPILLGSEFYPGGDVTTDEEIHQYIKENSYTVSHESATCKMGTASDPLAVVDSEGLVYGTQHLRVVDASIFPFLPPCFPQSVVYMAAEKIADVIKSTW